MYSMCVISRRVYIRLFEMTGQIRQVFGEAAEVKRLGKYAAAL